jgi:DNA-binding transcriptional LysR family regulator
LVQALVMLHNRILTYLDEVARAGSIRAASRKLNVASSAINRQILSLEEELGTPLFDRLPRGLRLTAAGELIVEHVRLTLRGQDRLNLQIADLIGLRWGRVTVATIGTVAAEIMPLVVQAFRRDHPRSTIEVRVVADPSAEVEADEVDIGIGFDLSTPAGLETVFDIPVVVGAVLPPGHPLAARSLIALSSCAGYPLIMPSKAMSTRPILDRAIAKLGDTIQATVISNSVELMKQAVKLDQGIAFLTAFNVATEVARGELVFVPLIDSRNRPLHLTGVLKPRHQMNLMTLPFIRMFERQAGAMLMTGEA